MSDLQPSIDEELLEVTRRLERAGDHATLLALKAFSRLVTTGCLNIILTAQPPLYRAAEGVDLSLLAPEERVVMQSAGSFIGEILPALLNRAAARIRETLPESRREVGPSEAASRADISGAVAAALQASAKEALAEALKYQPPESSCSV